MIKLTDILDFVTENNNSAFFYTPVIYRNPVSYFLKYPEIVLRAENRREIDDVLKEADNLLQNENIMGIALIPYEAGYFLQNKNVQKRFRKIKSEAALQFVFYDKRNVEVVNSDDIDHIDIEKYLFNQFKYENIKLNCTKTDYIDAISEIKKHISEGDCYQINYTAKLKFNLKKHDLKPLFLKGIFNQSSAYTAFLNTDEHYILSFSPELFFETDFETVKSKPMKGTAKRGKSRTEDESIIRTLLKDEKNLAENVMIVDLLRNDIGKISKIGSVDVPKLFEVEKYETLFQLTSTVTGKLQKNKTSEIIKNLFPCGSITGAPKIKTMEIINRLEKEPRGIYTGTIGLLTNKKAVFNVAIRTLTLEKKNGKAEFGLGSGIVWDSAPENEFDEVLLKGNFLTQSANYFELLETILFEDGKFFLLDEHLNRLKESAGYFLFHYDESKLVESLENISAKLENRKKFKIRLTLTKWGNVKIAAEELKEDRKHIKVLLAPRKPAVDEKFYFHKTTYRPWETDLAVARKKGFAEVIFFDGNNKLLEGAISNVFIKKDENYFTPPDNLPLLSGCFRNHLLKTTSAQEKVLTIKDLKTADEIFLCNSVRKKITVDEIYDDEANLIYKA